jgi:hypothetical protein
MIKTFAFRGTTVNIVKTKCEKYLATALDYNSAKIEAFYDGNFYFSKYMPEGIEALIKKLETRGGKKLLTDKGHFTVTLIWHPVTISEVAKDRVIWEED